MPNLEWSAHGNKHCFLIDTGVSCSSVTGLMYEGPDSAGSAHSVGIDRVPIFIPSAYVHERWRKFTVIPESPVNLLGRDTMHKLGTEIVFPETDVSFLPLSADGVH